MKSRCRFKVKDLRGQVFKCPKCGLIGKDTQAVDRQKLAFDYEGLSTVNPVNSLVTVNPRGEECLSVDNA